MLSSIPTAPTSVLVLFPTRDVTLTSLFRAADLSQCSQPMALKRTHRAGDLRMDTGGLLRNGAGHLVMGDGGPVAIPPNSSLLIGSDGTVSVQPLGQGPEVMALVDRIKLVDPDASRLAKGEDGPAVPAGR